MRIPDRREKQTEPHISAHLQPNKSPSPATSQMPEAAHMQTAQAAVDQSPRQFAQRTFVEQLRTPSAAQTGPAGPGSAVTQLRTDIQHSDSYVQVNMGGIQGSHRVGSRMRALLDVEDPVVGSATGTNWTWMQALRQQYFHAGVVRGHLLNHDLGGISMEENLYPISTEANINHSASVEQPVKEMLNEQQDHLDDNEPARRIFYAVNVAETNKGDPQLSSFNCEFGLEGDARRQKVNIESNLGQDVRRYAAPGDISPHDAWYHGHRRGSRDVGLEDYQQHGQINIQHNNLPVGFPAFQESIDAEYQHGAGLERETEENVRAAARASLHGSVMALVNSPENRARFGDDMNRVSHYKEEALEQALDTEEYKDNQGDVIVLVAIAVGIFDQIFKLNTNYNAMEIGDE